jgi:hypothetical protein
MLRDFIADELNNIVFDGAIFVVVVSWTPAAHNCMIPCDPPTTGKAKPILLQINHF